MGNVTNYELTLFVYDSKTDSNVDNLIDTIIKRAFLSLSLSPVSIILFSSSGVAMLMRVFHIGAGLL